MDNAFHDDIHKLKEIFDFLSDKKFTNCEILTFSEALCFTLPQIEDFFLELNVFSFDKQGIEKLFIDNLDIGTENSSKLTYNKLLPYFNFSNCFSDTQKNKIVTIVKGLISSSLSQRFKVKSLIRRHSLVSDFILMIYEKDSNLNRVFDWIYNIYMHTQLNEKTYYESNQIWTIFKNSICHAYIGCDVFIEKENVKCTPINESTDELKLFNE